MKKYFAGLCFLLIGCGAQPPENWSEIPSEKLLLCGNKPNCISSVDKRDKYAAAPLSFTGSKDNAVSALAELIGKLENTAVIDVTDSRLHAVRTSKIFGFKDDLFFVFEDDGTVNVRSSARSGYYDFGVNRKEMEKIRQKWNSLAGG